MKQLLILILFFTALNIQAQSKSKKKEKEPEPIATITDSTEIEMDTFKVVLLFSQCPICNPQTDIGFMTAENQGTKKKPDYQVKAILDSQKKPMGENIIIWNYKQTK